jgi:hypothetical protein
MAAQRDAGTCYIKCNGDQLVVDSGVEAPLSSVTRETVMGSGRPVGYKETGREAFVNATLRKINQKDFQKIIEADDLTITVEFANGGVYTLSDAWVKGEPTYNGDEGTADIEFGGLRGSWA